jgi:hypothetical protein
MFKVSCGTHVPLPPSRRVEGCAHPLPINRIGASRLVFASDDFEVTLLQSFAASCVRNLVMFHPFRQFNAYRVAGRNGA